MKSATFRIALLTGLTFLSTHIGARADEGYTVTASVTGVVGAGVEFTVGGEGSWVATVPGIAFVTTTVYDADGNYVATLKTNYLVYNDKRQVISRAKATISTPGDYTAKVRFYDDTATKVAEAAATFTVRPPPPPPPPPPGG